MTDTEAERTAKNLAETVREKDAAIRDMQRKLNGLRTLRESLHNSYLYFRGQLDMAPLEAASPEPAIATVEEREQVKMGREERPKPQRRRGRKPDPNTKLAIATMEAFLSRTKRPTHRKFILQKLEATEGVHIDMNAISGYLSWHSQFMNTHPGDGLWSLPEYVDNPPIWEDDDLEFELAKVEESDVASLPDVVNLNVYKQETKEGRNNA